MKISKAALLAATLGAVFTVSACSTDSVVDNTVGATGFVAKTAVKGTIGAGKLAYRGAKHVVGTGAN